MSPSRPTSNRARQADSSELPFENNVLPLRRRGKPLPVMSSADDEDMPTKVFDNNLPDATDAGYSPIHLYIERGPRAGQSLPLPQGAIVIGRASVSDLRLQHASISRRHAQLTRRGERFYIRDLGSQNGVFVNKQRAVGEVEVRVGDLVALGNAQLVLKNPSQRQSARAPANENTDERSAPKPKAVTGGGRMAVVAAGIGFGIALLAMGGAIKLLEKKKPQKAVASTVLQIDTPVLRVSPPGEEPATEGVEIETEKIQVSRDAEPAAAPKEAESDFEMVDGVSEPPSKAKLKGKEKEHAASASAKKKPVAKVAVKPAPKAARPSPKASPAKPVASKTPPSQDEIDEAFETDDIDNAFNEPPAKRSKGRRKTSIDAVMETERKATNEFDSVFKD